MAGDDLYQEAREVLTAACRRTGLNPADAKLLRLRSNAVFRLREPIIVRIATAPDATERLSTVLAVTRWLADRGFPTVQPAEIPDQPMIQHGRVVTFWQYVPTSEAKPTTADLGRLLRRLHNQPPPPYTLRTLTDPLSRIRLSVTPKPDVLNPDEWRWLTDRIDELTGAWNHLEFAFPPTLLHGDGWIDNLLRAEDGQVVLCDWDSVAVGPREWDLIPTYHGHRRFGLTTPDVHNFADAYGWDLRDWPGYPTLLQIRDLYAIGIHIRNAPGDDFSRRELATRLHSLTTGDLHATWHLAGDPPHSSR